MQLIKTISNKPYLDHAIYELNESEEHRFGHKYALSQGVFSEFAIMTWGTEKLLSKLTPLNYEGFFDSVEEAESAIAEWEQFD